MRAIMDNKHNIRNITVIAEVDHGKSTLVDSLVIRAGIMTCRESRYCRYTEIRAPKSEIGLMIKSSHVSLFFEYNLEAGEVIKNERIVVHVPEGIADDVDINQNSFLINVIDSPEHVDVSLGVSAALRVTDGALVVVDNVDGIAVQAGTLLRQAMAERVKPVLMVNKIDRALLELQLRGEEIYQNMRRAIENVNIIIESYSFGDKDWQVDPYTSTAIFGSGLHQWGFSLKVFAGIYAAKFQISEEKMLEKLWGDWCLVVNDGEVKWVKSNSVNANGGIDKESGARRSFVTLIMNPIMHLCAVTMNNTTNKKGELKAFNMAKNVGVNLTEGEKKALTGKPLLKRIMMKWLPLADAVLEMIVVKLPSPASSQLYRTEALYDGPMGDEASEAIRTCDDSEGAPLMMYVSKMVPCCYDDKNRFLAFGRVFSGRVTGGQKIRLLGPNFAPGKKTDLFTKFIHRVVILMGRYTEYVADIPAGNICGLVGIDQYLVKTGTITNLESACCIKTMKFAVSSLVHVAVSVKNPQDLPRLMEGLKRLSRFDPIVKCDTSETGEHIIAGCGEMHLDKCLKVLAHDFLRGVPLHTSAPVVTHQEVVTKQSKQVLAKSANNHNILFCEAIPLNSQICKMFEENELSSAMDVKERSKILNESSQWWPEFNVFAAAPQKIWCFGDNLIGPNIFTESTVGVAHLDEIKDSVVGGFEWACSEGPICGERIRGLRMNLNDITLHADPIHRCMGQICPCSRRATFAGVYCGTPTLMEPVYVVNITCPTSITTSVYNVLSTRRGQVFDEGPDVAGGVANWRAYLPVAESFGFSQSLSTATSGAAFYHFHFGHWQMIEASNPNAFRDTESQLGKTVAAIRTRKGLTAECPPLDRYLDTIIPGG